jgi:hypothetical protein
MDCYSTSIKGLNREIRLRKHELRKCIYHVEMFAKAYRWLKGPKKDNQKTYVEWVERALELHKQIKRLRIIRSQVILAKQIVEILKEQNNEYYIWKYSA